MVKDYRLRQRDYLLRIARAMTSRHHLSDLLALVTKLAVELTGGSAGAVVLRQGQGFEVATRHGLDAPYGEALRRLVEAVAGRVPLATTGRHWPRQMVEGALRQLIGELRGHVAQVIALPLVTGEELLGVLFVFRSPNAAYFTTLDTELVEAFADQAAIAIRNANLVNALQQRAETERRLYEGLLALASAGEVSAALASAADHARRASDSDWVLVVELDGELVGRQFQQGQHFALPGPAVQRVARAGAALLEEAAVRLLREMPRHPATPEVLRKSPLREGALLAIRGRRGLIGLLWVGRERPIAYSDEALQLLATLANNLGLVLDRFHLLQQLRQRERQLSSIVENSPTGMLLLDGEGRVTLTNPVVAALLPGSRARAGQRLEEVLSLRDEQGRTVNLAMPEEGETASVVDGYPDAAPGRFFRVSITALPGRGAEQVGGYVVTLVDLTTLKEAEQAKSAFLAGLSHELKTPLSIIRGYTETLRYPQVREDGALFNEMVDVILDETGHLTQMVDQMLLAARLEAGVLALEWDEVALAPLVRAVVETFRQTYPERRWELDLAEGLSPLRADAGRLREVLQNLLSNAVKYSDPDARIRVELAADGERAICLRVRDEGIGIPEAEQERLFERFYRASDRAEGTGLGLYMSRAIVEAHGGWIEVESREGAGSTFTVWLPRDGMERREEEKEQ